MGERVVVGMSGGVDSSVAAALLVEQGHDVVGVTLRVWPWREPDQAAERFGSCCSPETVDDARQVARRLGIPYYLLNSEREFDATVVEDFAREYARGRTPVPCTVCNRDVKFGSLLHRARAWDAAAVATGHYARVSRDPVTGRWRLWRGRDLRKDQSDFLWPLSQSQLAAARFPVGELTKDEVREKARALGLPTAEKPESQEICFIPDDDYRAFLRGRIPQAFRPGPIVNASGRVLGAHRGLANYTVGQRRGLGLAQGAALYVTALDPDRNALVVGPAGEVEHDRLWAEQVNLISLATLEGPLDVEVKIRHSHAPAPATIHPVPAERARAAGAEGLVVEVRFASPQRAAAPGQSAVFYQGELVVGGGVIARRDA
ncbi:MAG TPA: tRNA 2-thiouridine(34) synthase MnmA [Methylomirabilota bacterium]|nr:tRNA 2-thiouridine(34) synthase MnmA [Methylomirabilota bacterium]